MRWRFDTGRGVICIGGKFDGRASGGEWSGPLSVCPRLRAAKLEEAEEGVDRREPNSLIDVFSGKTNVLGDFCERLSTAAGEAGGFSFSRREAVLLRKLSPRIERRPSGDAAFCDTAGELVGALLLLDLREKKGMPEGVRRGLSSDERDRPGLVATTDGGAVTMVFGCVAVPALLMLDVRVRGMVEIALSLFEVWRTPLAPVVDALSTTGDRGVDEFEARPAMSLVDPVRRRDHGSERCPESDASRGRGEEELVDKSE